MTPELDTRAVVEAAQSVGFDQAGVVTERLSDHLTRLRAWLRDGLHGEMGYLAREDAVERRGDLAKTLPEFVSAVVVTQEYGDGSPTVGAPEPSRGLVARYARGRDYHLVMAEGLDRLGERLEAAAGRPVRRRLYVDTGPLLERELGQRAGLGWFGKNTMVIHPRRGSYFFLGVLLTDLALRPSAPFEEEHCGTCRRCLDACPTGALLGRDEAGAPLMDARRCISYLTIELKGPIPKELRPAIGNRIFGCDICQEVCPFNEKFSVATAELQFRPRGDLDQASLLELAHRLLNMSEKEFGRVFAESPVLRARRKGMLRNVCVALGNWGTEESVPTLVAALSDPAVVVRGHAAWALGQVGSVAAKRGLEEASAKEEDPWVREELELALSGSGRPTEPTYDDGSG